MQYYTHGIGSKNKMKIIVKLHPSQSIHNEIIKKVIKEFDKNIPIHLISPVTELINTSDAVVTITPEGWAPSTVILESLILKKPVMNIILDNNLYDFQYVQFRLSHLCKLVVVLLPSLILLQIPFS